MNFNDTHKFESKDGQIQKEDGYKYAHDNHDANQDSPVQIR